MKAIGEFETHELVEELKKREGVTVQYAAPHANYSVATEDTGINETGPATILVVID